MTQIINLLSFIKELLFNRGKKDGKKDHKSGFLHTLLLAVLAASLYGNYLLAGRVYEKTKQIISLKNEVQELRPMADKVAELQYINTALSNTIALLTGGTAALGRGKVPLPSPLPPQTPKEALMAPAPPPNNPQRQLPAKENKVE